MKVYGFMSWMLAALGTVVFILWAILPDHVLRAIGISYYPSKWWVVAASTYLVVSLFLGAFFYLASSFFMAPPLTSRRLIVDSFSAGKTGEFGFEIPSARDLPWSAVNRLVLGDLVSRAGARDLNGPLQ